MRSFPAACSLPEHTSKRAPSLGASSGSLERPLLAAFVAPLGVLLLIAACLAPGAHAQDTAGTPPASAQGQVIDEIAAVVEDEVILRSEVEGQVQAVLQQQRRQQGRAPQPEEVRQQVLQSRIDQQVLATHARRDTNITVSDAQVQQYLDRRIEQLAQRAGGREQLEQAYGKSINELKAEFEDRVRSQLLAQQFQQTRLQEVRITPTEVRDWFEGLPQDSLPTLPPTVRLSHIVRYPEATESAKRQAREVISAVRDSALAGTPIEDLARRYSDDTGSASQGGRIQTSLDDLVPSFAAVVSRAPIGEISQVFQTPFGYHIARVNERSGNTVDFNHVLIEVDRSTAPGTEAKEYLEAVRDSIVNQGAPFGLMARRHSEEESSAGQGGRVTDPRSGETTLRLNALGSSWQDTISDLDEGDISQPSEVQLLDGQRAFHIVKLQERTPRHRVNLEQDYARIKELALQEKKQRVYQNWVQKLREDVYVDVRAREEDLAASAR